MTCQEFETQIASYMDGSLSDAESAAIDEHASTCATCEVRLEQMTARSMVAFDSTRNESALRHDTAIGHRSSELVRIAC